MKIRITDPNGIETQRKRVKAGTEIDVDDRKARVWIKAGQAVEVKEGPAAKAKPTRS